MRQRLSEWELSGKASKRAIARREVIFLVVMAVFLGLAIIPFLKRRQADAAEARSLNNLVQWGIGLNLYLIDHENRLPRVGPSKPVEKGDEMWYDALPPYLSQKTYTQLKASDYDYQDLSTQIWRDPVIEEMFGGTLGDFIFPYGMNRWLQPLPEVPSYAIYDLMSPRSVVFLAESASTDPGLLPSSVSYRHGRSTSASAISYVMFVDGHAAPVTREVLSAEPNLANDAPQESVTWLPFPGAPQPSAYPGGPEPTGL